MKDVTDWPTGAAMDLAGFVAASSVVGTSRREGFRTATSLAAGGDPGVLASVSKTF